MNDTSTTKHNHDVVFGHRVSGCPRCAELNNGAPARKGWGHDKRVQEQRLLARIRNHIFTDFDTTFDW